MFAGSGGAIIIGAAATTTAGRCGSRDTVTVTTIITIIADTIIITGTITTAGIVTDPELCCVPDRGATAFCGGSSLDGRPAELC
jgi:hypothetical protein